jgi:cytochrome P450
VTITAATDLEDVAAALRSAEGIADPYRVYDRLRAISPVVWSDTFHAWIATGHAEVLEVYSRGDVFVVSGRPSRADSLPEDVRERIPTVILATTTPALATADPPTHTRQRGLFQRSLTPRRLAGHREWIEERAAGLADELAARPGPDLLEHFTQPMAYAAILGLFGAPLEHVPIYRRAADAHFSYLGYGHDRDSLVEAALRFEDALVAFREALESIYDEQRARPPGETILSTVLQPENPDDALEPDELFAVLALFFTAATDNLIYTPAVAMLQLLRQPEQLELVKHDRALAAAAYEESVRWETAFHVNSRMAAVDVELAGQQIRAGDHVLMIKAAANRDPNVWTDPNAFDLRRDPNEAPAGHAGFGRGIHFCIGAGLARIVGPTEITTLLGRFPRIHLPSGWEPSWSGDPMTRRLLALPVELD